MPLAVIVCRRGWRLGQASGDPAERNEWRFYRMEVWPDLFGRALLLRQWGRTCWVLLAPFIAGRPDDKSIAAHWDDVLRLAASVRTGVVSASLMLKRLGSCQNGLALALREIGLIERTLYTLD